MNILVLIKSYYNLLFIIIFDDIHLWYFVFVFIFLLESGFSGLNKVDYDTNILKIKQEKLFQKWEIYANKHQNML